VITVRNTTSRQSGATGVSAAAGDAGSGGRPGDRPDQIDRTHDIEQQAATEIGRNKGDGTPEPDAAIGSAVDLHAFDGQRIRQRHDGCMRDCGEADRHEDGQRTIAEADGGIAKGGRNGRPDQRFPDSPSPVGDSGQQRDRRDAHEGRRCQHKADLGGIEALGLKPERKKQQLDADQHKIGRIECGQADGETAGG
jgi:hypothetical protein